ncbi:uncharacterized protein LOC136091337 isoform X2 [Hydra vulgaris]|uniref:Uncharacterized protein LOC136091337 isoform X2 n=1 Tax=Hydra vulgaris TaxID=6087 RepID=A0ABM4DJY5_HYDVU
MSPHITASCANTIVPCQYFYIGCNFKGMRKEQDTHVNYSTQKHLSMAVSKVAANEKEITILKNEMEIRKKQDAQVKSLTQNQFLATLKMVELEKKMKTKVTKPNKQQVNTQENHDEEINLQFLIDKTRQSIADYEIRPGVDYGPRFYDRLNTK